MENDYFQFSSAEESQSPGDFHNMAPCPHCAKPIPADAITCYYCGRSVDRRATGHPALRWVLLLLILSLLVLWTLQRFG